MCILIHKFTLASPLPLYIYWGYNYVLMKCSILSDESKMCVLCIRYVYMGILSYMYICIHNYTSPLEIIILVYIYI